MRRRLALLLAVAAFCSMGAEIRTQNFVVSAANQQVCQQVAQWAEHYRREKALQWLGHEMPNWPEPCPLRVQVTMEGPSGATEFQFQAGSFNFKSTSYEWLVVAGAKAQYKGAGTDCTKAGPDLIRSFDPVDSVPIHFAKRSKGHAGDDHQIIGGEFRQRLELSEQHSLRSE